MCSFATNFFPANLHESSLIFALVGICDVMGLQKEFGDDADGLREGMPRAIRSCVSMFIHLALIETINYDIFFSTSAGNAFMSLSRALRRFACTITNLSGARVKGDATPEYFVKVEPAFSRFALIDVLSP